MSAFSQKDFFTTTDTFLNSKESSTLILGNGRILLWATQNKLMGNTQPTCYGLHSPASDNQQCRTQLLKYVTWLRWLNISSSLLAVGTSAWSSNFPINIFRRVICSSSVNGSRGILGTFWSSLLKLQSNLDAAVVGRFCSNASCKEQLFPYDTGCEALMIWFNWFRTGVYGRFLLTLP